MASGCSIPTGARLFGEATLCFMTLPVISFGKDTSLPSSVPRPGLSVFASHHAASVPVPQPGEGEGTPKWRAEREPQSSGPLMCRLCKPDWTGQAAQEPAFFQTSSSSSFSSSPSPPPSSQWPRPRAPGPWPGRSPFFLTRSTCADFPVHQTKIPPTAEFQQRENSPSTLRSLLTQTHCDALNYVFRPWAPLSLSAWPLT